MSFKSLKSTESLDEQFAKFLDESVSTDASYDSEKIDELLEEKKEDEEHKPWWLKSDDSQDKGAAAIRKQNWLKKQASLTENKTSTDQEFIATGSAAGTLSAGKDENQVKKKELRSEEEVSISSSINSKDEYFDEFEEDIVELSEESDERARVSVHRRKSAEELLKYIDELKGQEFSDSSKDSNKLVTKSDSILQTLQDKILIQGSQPSPTTEERKVKRVTFTDKDELVSPPKTPSSSDEDSTLSTASLSSSETSNVQTPSAPKNQLSSRIAATFSSAVTSQEYRPVLLSVATETSSEWIDYDTVVNELKDTLSQQEKRHEDDLKSKMSTYLEEIKDLQHKLQMLTDEVNGRKLRKETNSNFQENEITALLDTSQRENKRLYAELKDLKQKHKSDAQKLEVEKRSLSQEVGLLREQVENKQSRIDRLKSESINFKSSKKSDKELEDLKYEISAIKEQYEIKIECLVEDVRKLTEVEESLQEKLKDVSAKDEEIEMLRMQVADYQSKLRVHKRNDSQSKSNQKNVENCRIRDLERQVKEMEAIVRRRHPNSIPSLIFASSQTKSNDERINFLENKLKLLESELEKKDESSKMTLDNLQREYDSLKNVYEGHRKYLEEQIDKLKVKSEISSVRKSRSLENSPVRPNKLNNEYDKEISALRNKIGDLEKKLIVVTSSGTKRKFGSEHSSTIRHAASSRHGQAYKVPMSLHSANVDSESQYNRNLREENSQLFEKIRKLNLQLEQQQDCEQATMIELESNNEQKIKQYENKLRLQETAHRQQIELLRSDYVFRHSTSRTAKLLSQVESQQIAVDHLQTIVNNSKDGKKELEKARENDKNLKIKIESLEDELAEIRVNQSPKVKQYEILRQKILQLERRYTEKETHLDKIIRRVVGPGSYLTQTDDDRVTWKRRFNAQRRQVEEFKVQLEQIMEILRELNEQGVVVTDFRRIAQESV